MPNIVSPFVFLHPGYFRNVTRLPTNDTVLYPSNGFIPLFLNRPSEKKKNITLQNSYQLSISSHLSQPNLALDSYLPNSFQSSRFILSFHSPPLQKAKGYVFTNVLSSPLHIIILSLSSSYQHYHQGHVHSSKHLLAHLAPVFQSIVRPSPIPRAYEEAGRISRASRSLTSPRVLDRTPREREREREHPPPPPRQGTLLGRRRYTPRSGVAGETRYTEKYRVPTQETDST